LYKLSIIIPVFNEEKTFSILLDRVLKVRFPIKIELVIVDDGSKDKTLAIAKKYSKKYSFIKVFSKKNGGKGSAVRLGLKKASGNLFVVQDADLEYDPNDLLNLLKFINQGYPVVYGSRFKSNIGHLKNNLFTYHLHTAGNQFLSFLTSILYFQWITDMETCYKMFTKSVLKSIGHLEANHFELEPEITAKILRSAYKIKEVPINYHSRSFDEGKKITWRDGLVAVKYLIKYKFMN